MPVLALQLLAVLFLNCHELVSDPAMNNHRSVFSWCRLIVGILGGYVFITFSIYCSDSYLTDMKNYHPLDDSAKWSTIKSWIRCIAAAIIAAGLIQFFQSNVANKSRSPKENV